MEHFSFPFDGIGLNEILSKIGVETIDKDGVKFWKFGEKEIERPGVLNAEQVLEDEFGLKVSYY